MTSEEKIQKTSQRNGITDQNLDGFEWDSSISQHPSLYQNWESVRPCFYLSQNLPQRQPEAQSLFPMERTDYPTFITQFLIF